MKSNLFQFLAPILYLVLLAAPKASATILLSDDFAGSGLDTNKWSTNTTLADVYGTPSVMVTGGLCEITARGYLNTVTNYNPSAPGGLFITGSWTFVHNGATDLPTIVTRSSGIPTSYSTASGEPTEGIDFRFVVSASATINIYGSGAANVTGLNVISNTLSLAQGDTVTFSVTDDGTNLSFNVMKVGDPTEAASATAVCTNQLVPNLISFYNREYSSDTAGLSNVVVQTLPSGPQLTIAPAGNLSVLFWPASATNYILQSTTNLASTNWMNATDAVPVIAVTVTNQLPTRFFRLQPQN